METIAEQITRILQSEDTVSCPNALHNWVEIMKLKTNQYMRKCAKCNREQEYKEKQWVWING